MAHVPIKENDEAFSSVVLRSSSLLASHAPRAWVFTLPKVEDPFLATVQQQTTARNLHHDKNVDGDNVTGSHVRVRDLLRPTAYKDY